MVLKSTPYNLPKRMWLTQNGGKGRQLEFACVVKELYAFEFCGRMVLIFI
jgi:hypothetical protein